MNSTTLSPASNQSLLRAHLRDWADWLTKYATSHQGSTAEEAQAAIHEYAYQGCTDDLEPLCAMLYTEILTVYRQTFSVGRRAVYCAYLHTDHWAEVRQKVMRRARGWCEGCGEHRATEVHHLTYDHVGNEMLFELVALCRECHEKLKGEAA